MERFASLRFALTDGKVGRERVNVERSPKGFSLLPSKLFDRPEGTSEHLLAAPRSGLHKLRRVRVLNNWKLIQRHGGGYTVQVGLLSYPLLEVGRLGHFPAYCIVLRDRQSK